MEWERLDHLQVGEVGFVRKTGGLRRVGGLLQ